MSLPSSPLDESGGHYFAGKELVTRRGIHPSNLSDAMILGLQAYHPVDFSVICDPYGINDGMRLSARSRLASVLGRGAGIEKILGIKSVSGRAFIIEALVPQSPAHLPMLRRLSQPASPQSPRGRSED